MTFEGFTFEKYADGGWIYTRPSKIYGCAVTQSGRCIGDAVERYEGQAAYGEFWINEFLRLDETQRDITRAVFGDIDVRGATGELQPPTKLHRIAMVRLKKWGLLRACPRCGGSGNYSYNTRDGTQCYGCGGLGLRLADETGDGKGMVQQN